VVICTIRRNDGSGSENIRQGKNTAAGGWDLRREDGTDDFPRLVCKEFPLYTA
jgi:hypothetical protein